MSSQYIAVLDVGKTNKKILIFDSELKIIDKAYSSFSEEVKGNIHFENIVPMVAWVKNQLREFAKKYAIKAISVTTHGATAFCIDKNGNLACPPVAYTTEASDEFRKEFYETFGDVNALQKETATAEIGSLINIGKKIYFLKKNYPEQFENVATILNYPQYFGYLFTGKIGADPTYVGCHTYLYDFSKHTYSKVADKLGITSKLPPKIDPSWDVLGTISSSFAHETGLPNDCIVTMGIHDSNSSLLPYRVKGYKNFVLNSTGTWCVAMHPVEEVSFKDDEIGKLVFFNLDAFSKPVKTSIFMGGLEFETYIKLIQKINNRTDYPEFDVALCKQVIDERRYFILPSVVKGTGLFPQAQPTIIDGDKRIPLSEIDQGNVVPSFFTNYEVAYVVLNLSLAIQTGIALHAAGFEGRGEIFTEGGFRLNTTYNPILSALFPDARCALTRLDEATAFGAAILGKAALDKVTPHETKDLFEIEILPVEKPNFSSLNSYREAFIRFL